MLTTLLALLTLMTHQPTFPQEAPLHTEAIEYKDGDVVLEGWLAYDPAIKGPRPGVLIVHEWRGHGDYVRSRAAQIARLGYAAFAIDMYGKGVHAKTHEEAARLSGVFFKDRKMMRARALSGLERFRQVEVLDKTRIAAMGYCFGGTTVLEMARAGHDLRGVASFHGGLTAPPGSEAKAGIKPRIAVFHGSKDPHIGPEQLTAFDQEMNDAGADWFLVSFGNTMHSFTVKDANMPESGLQYNADADRRSWEMLKDFLAECFRP